MKITKRRIYTVEVTGKVYTVEFFKEDNCPGFSHRVTIIHNGKTIAKDRLSAKYRISVDVVKYFIEKHIGKDEYTPRQRLVNALVKRLVEWGEVPETKSILMNELVEGVVNQLNDNQVKHYYMRVSDAAYYKFVNEARKQV